MVGTTGSSNPQARKLPLWVMMITGGVAGSVGEIATIPLDTAKVRLQIQGGKGQGAAGADSALKYRGMLHAITVIAKEEGPAALYKGLVAGLQRQMLFASLRIGLYEPVRDLVIGKDVKEPSFGAKVVAGLITGTIGILVANPTDIVKIRLQAEGNLPPGVPKRYNGVMDAYRKIIATEGPKGLWVGLVPNIARNSIINATELATFDEAKQQILKTGLMKDNIFCHFAASAIAGCAAVLVGSPVDVLKTRVMNAPKGTGVMETVVNTLKQEGPLAFYKGVTANAWRIVSWNIVMFVCLQQSRAYIQEKYYTY